MALTPSQEAAVLYDRNLILFAGPGSGKTSTSVAKGERILGMDGTRLGMVTFTTAGASEMQERMLAAFASRSQQIPANKLTTGTFHSLTLRHYQRHTTQARKLMAPPARSTMINSMLRDLDFDTRSEHILALEKYQGCLNPENLVMGDDEREFVESFLARLEAINAIDLAGVMRSSVMAMRSGSMPLFPLTHLIGDEMQDADELQLELMLLHAKAGITTTLVGDDDQTIYEWRSALGYEGLMRFAHETGAKTITLAENFRSRSEIVSHAQALISKNNPQRIDKNPRAVRGPGGHLGSAGASDIQTECDNIASAIYTYRRDGESIAILGRSNRDLDQIEQALLQHVDENDDSHPIPYQRDGQSIWQTPEVASLVSLIHAVLRGHLADVAATLSILPIASSSRVSLERAIGFSCGAFLEGTVPDFKAETTEELKTVQSLAAATSFARRKIRTGEVAFALECLVSETRRLLLEHKKSRPNQVNALLKAASSILMKLTGTLSQRLATVQRMQPRNPDNSVVRLMTMHSSKGLEFNTVFMFNAVDPDDGSTMLQANPERRLFYVGMTRAKDRLLVSYSGTPVKFIDEAAIPVFPSLDSIFKSGECSA